MKHCKKWLSVLCALLLVFVAAFGAACDTEEEPPTPPTPPPQDPVTYTVTFVLDCEGTPPAAQTVEKGKSASEPAEPDREGYSFLGWYKDVSAGDKFDFSTKIEGNLTLHAKWEILHLSVVFDFNYSGAQEVKEEVTWGEKVQSKSVDPREGFEFGGWFSDKACVTEYNFDLPVKEDLRLFAKWTDVSKTYYEVTYHYNYPDAPEAIKGTVEEGQPASRPQDPERNGYEFKGWYLEEDASTLYEFGTPVTRDLDLYAGWEEALVEQTLVVEAEYTDLEGIKGIGFSSNPEGIDLIQNDYRGLAKASGGFFVGSLYKRGVTLTFTFTSDRAVGDAELKLRLSGELLETISLTKDEMEVKLNGTKLSYETIVISGIDTDMSKREKREFADFTVGKGLRLNEGENVVTLTITNDKPMTGMIKSMAPMVDCLKVIAKANLDYEPIEDNLRNFDY